METFLQPLVLAFREGLEAFLIITILLKFLDKTNNENLKKHVWNGTYLGIAISIVLGFILVSISNMLNNLDTTTKIWESGASLTAVLLITTFIIWMIKHGRHLKHHIEQKAELNLTSKGLLLLSMVMVLREGAEIAIFAFAGKYPLFPVTLGITISIIFATLIHHSLIKVNLNTLFTATLGYLILQAGFLLGYGIHEGIEALKGLKVTLPANFLFAKAFDLSQTIFNHKEGVAGLPLYVAIGWYSKPEWLQFLAQYGYTAGLFLYWKKYLDIHKLKG